MSNQVILAACVRACGRACVRVCVQHACVCANVCLHWVHTLLLSVTPMAGVVYDEDSPADIVVLQEDFLVALKELEPSVSSDDLKKYDKLRHFHKQS